MTPGIQFGTDGWRGVMADDFTFENVRIVSQAAAEYFQTVEDRAPAVLVGYDVRFLSAQFARAAAEVLAGNGLRVHLLDRPLPTPYVSFEVARRGLAGGVVITASHNPYIFNGFKVKAHYGGSATPAITRQIEQRLGATSPRAGAGIEIESPSESYGGRLRSLVDWERIAASRLEITTDSMHGSGGRLLEELLRGTTCTVQTIRAEPDPLFGGIHPEPMMPQLQPLAEAVRRTSSDIGLALDGDADRLGVVDNTGRFVSTLEVLPLLLLHLHRNRGWTGGVAYTFSQSQLVQRIARKLGLETFETPIGFKNIAEIMLRRPLLIGGEESGGVGVSRHLPERDGLLIHLLLLDLLAAEKKPLDQLIHNMWREFGEFHYQRKDLTVPLDASARLLETLRQNPPARIGDRRVQDVQTLDGVKLLLEDDAWILFRRSGTEPILRVYCEAPDRAAAAATLAAGCELVELSGGPGVH